MNKCCTYFLVSCLFLLPLASPAQIITDSAGREVVVDTMVAERADTANIITPRKAAIRSAIIPGWGQISVRRDMDGSFFSKYWKIPVIYGAIAVPASLFVYNLTWYRRSRYAYTVLYKRDVANYPNVHIKLQGFLEDENEPALRYLRDEFRKDMDYSALFFLAMWGLNVVDASVDAHLKTFDVSPDLGLRLRTGYSDMAGTHGLSFVLTFK